MVLSAQTIEKLCKQKEEPLLDPFCLRDTYEGVSFGLSAAGYDVRVEFDQYGLIPAVWLEPGEFLLASTIEKFHMPRDIVGIVHDKSTWARHGIAVQNTVIEPGWSGWLTLEITNHGSRTVKLMRGMGIAQVVFHLLDQPTEFPYEGKYQAQRRGPVGAKNDE